MTASEEMRNVSVQEGRKQNTMRNTLKCVLVLGAIAVVCVALLAIANRFLQPEVKLDRATSDMINEIAPTGADNDAAYASYIKMVDVSKGGYAITDLDGFNKKYGSANQKVRALYTSTHKDTGAVTLVVEAEGKGYVDAVVMLVAYDRENKVSGLTTKSQNESYWNHIKDEAALYAAFIGSSGQVNGSTIAAATGVTVRGTLGGMASAVSIANDFVVRLGGATQPPAPETDAEKISKLQKVASEGAASFTRYAAGGTVANVYISDKNDYIVEAKSTVSGYGNVTLLVRIAENAVAQLTIASDEFEPISSANSELLRNDSTLNTFFAGMTLADVQTASENSLAGSTGATTSARGIIDAVKNALSYEFTEEAA